MRVLSATEALSPAAERTRDLLFRPFRWGTFLKLCAVAIFTEGGSGSFNYSGHGSTTPTNIDPGSLGLLFSPEWIAVIIAVAIALIIVSIAIFYLSVRLRFALFECLIHQTRLIAPGWHKYRSQAFRFFILSIMVGIVFLLAIVVALLPFISGFWRIYQESRLEDQFPVAAFLALFLPLLPVLLLIFLTAISIDIVLRDFMLPHIALEDASAGQAWAAVRARIFREKADFLIYAVLRVIVPIGIMLVIVVVLIIPCLIVFGILGGGWFALHTYLDHAPMMNMIIGSVFEVVLGLSVVALALLVGISSWGPVCIALRNYALLFYSGRFQALGDILSPPPPGAPGMDPGAA